MLLSGIAVMISSIPSDAPCEAGGSSIIYQLNACTGGRAVAPEFDVDHDRLFDEKDLIQGLPPTGQKKDKTVFDAIELDGHLYLQDAGGWINDIGIPELPPGMTYWRMIE
jgi:type IV pilus assembly protein PilY1